MNLAGLRKDAERRLRRIERDLALIALAGDTWGLDRRRFSRLQSVPVAEYLQPNEEVELHRSMLPVSRDSYVRPAGTFCRLTVDRVGDCVGFWVPAFGNMALPAGDFVRAVLLGHVREPQESPAGEKLPSDAVG